ncbi:MbtH family protein [Streptomyces sp. 15-116A]|uniref:MbtH family protein n=1 Tax=Streptomyces sp. 15-116A TaxID=2259035 RepID=UPI0021B2F9D4|nr:MbtH family protein [Streptomyces sp. 15-116A]MCT7352930.1 MbtH family protein [Streptomyces sp. 15-116A]
MNPFEDDELEFCVVVDDLGRHALQPVFAGTPRGWRTVHGPADRGDCLAYVERHWAGPGVSPARESLGVSRGCSETSPAPGCSRS